MIPPTLRRPVFRSLRRGIALLAMLLLGACTQAPEEESPVLLRVNGRTVSLATFQQGLQRNLPESQSLEPAAREELMRTFLRQLLDRELALAEADRLGVSVSADEVAARLEEYRHDYPEKAFQDMLQRQGLSEREWRRELEERLRLEKTVRQEVYAGLVVHDDEIERYYREHRDEFDRPEQVRARQIVVETEAEGERLLGLIRQGQPFAEVARAHSLSPDAEQGGDLGFFAREQMPPEFDEVVFRLPVGKVSDLVRSEYGYHLFLVEERRPAQRLRLEAVHDQIRTRLHGLKEEEAYQAWLQELGRRAELEINWTLLK